MLDAIFLWALDVRTSRLDPPDPLNAVARWLWFELRDRQYRRAEARAMLDRAPAEGPRLDLSERWAA